MNLTKPQKLIYDMEKFAGGSIAIICGSMLVHGKKNLSQIKKAVNELYKINTALRIRIIENDGEVSQTICDYVEQNFNVLCFDKKAELDYYAEDYAKKPLDFYGSLCEINIVTLPDQYGLLIKLHHIIGDAWTLSLLGTQFNKLMNGEEVEAYSYADYVERENTYIKSKRYEKDKGFFVEQFKKCDEVTYLSEKQSDSLDACRKTFVIGKEQTRLINAYTQKKGTSAFMLFTAALATYMNRVKMNAEKFYIGTAVLNRSGVKENNTVGMFVNTAPMLMELDNTKSFAQNLSAIEDTAFSVFRHQKYNYGDVLSTIRKELNFTEKLYDVTISYQNATVSGADIETTWYTCALQTESLDLHIEDRDNMGMFRIHYDYLVDKFSEFEIDRIHQHICNLLFDAIDDDSKKLYELRILSNDEEQKLIYEFNNTVADYPRDKCIHQLFAEQVVENSEATALIFEGKMFTYKQLDEMSNSLANYLISIGVTRNDFVPILAKRSEFIIVAMLAIMKSGAAYVPLDFASPQERINYIIKELNANVILVYDRNDIFDIDTIKLNEFDYSNNTEKIDVINCPEDIIYAIYTSGSTGNPKGTKISHRNVVNYCFNSEKNFMIKRLKNECKCGSIVSINNICFDAFLDESFLPLLNGIVVFFASQEETTDCNKFLKLVNTNSIDVVSTTPTKFKILTGGRHCNLKHIILGGEVLKDDDLSYISSISIGSVYNTYGPTETTCGSTYTQII